MLVNWSDSDDHNDILQYRHNELRREDNENPRVNNGLYAPHANPFYR